MTSSDKNDDKVRPKPGGKKKYIYLALGVLVAVGIVLAAIPKPTKVELATAKEGLLVVDIEEDGITRVRDRYLISSPLSGYVSRLALRAGDAVEQNATLFTMTSLDAPLLGGQQKKESLLRLQSMRAVQGRAQSMLKASLAARDQASADLKRLEQLKGTGAVAEAEVDRARLKLRNLEEEVQSAGFSSKIAGS